MSERQKYEGLDVVSVRLVKDPPLYSDKPIRCMDDAIDVVAEELADFDREVFCTLNMRTSGKPINFSIVSMGTLDSSLVSPREVFKASLLSNAASVICLHNHPSQNPQYSNEDIETTKRLIAAGDILGIPVLDHIIVAGKNICSLRDKAGYLWDDRNASLDVKIARARGKTKAPEEEKVEINGMEFRGSEIEF